jgi:hypothetical protein
MTAALRNSSSLVKSSTQESFDYSSENCCTQKDLCSTSMGNIASELYTSENGVCPVAKLGVVRRALRTDVNCDIPTLNECD